MANYIIFGSWKIRHDEPLFSEEEQLFFMEFNEDFSIENKSIYCDLDDFHGLVTSNPYYKESIEISIANLQENYIPLGIMSTGDRVYKITHLIHRIESWNNHFLSLGNLPKEVSFEFILDELYLLFKNNYLYTNNFECFYEKGIPDTELEQKFNIEKNYNFYELNERFFAALDDCEIKNFQPHLGDEIEHWSYDNDFFEIAPNDKKMSGYVSVMNWSRKKKDRYDDPVVTYKKKLYDEDALERWERNYHFQYIKKTAKEDLSNFFGLPLKTLPSWRRVRLDIACEYLPTGDIYMLNFEDCRIKDNYDNKARLQQCEIEYLKTRGEAKEQGIYEGFNALVKEVEKFIKDQGLCFTKNHYSKLTFLKEYQENIKAV